MTETLRGEKVEYIPDSDFFPGMSIAWVEGVDGSGVGETITLAGGTYPEEINNLVLINGYVDFDRPDLYIANNRVRRIQLDFPNQDSIVYDLEDSWHPQTLEFAKSELPIVVTILDVFPGDKYDDTCISGIYTSQFRNFFPTELSLFHPDSNTNSIGK